MNIYKKLILFFYLGYKNILSPFLHTIAGPGSGCRHEPNCSRYAFEAFNKHGFLKGAFLSLKRLLKCHPFSKGGVDPVP